MTTTSGSNYTTLYNNTASQTQPSGPAGSNLAVQDEGTTVTSTANTLNFIGAGVTASAVGNVVTIDVPGDALEVQEEGSVVANTANTLNFTGSGVTATAVGNVVTIAVPGQTIANIIANVNSNVSIPNANGNIVINANAGTNEQWIFDTTGNITTPANSVISSVTNDLTLSADTLFNNLRVAGVADNGGLPSFKQGGWFFNSNWISAPNPSGLWSNPGLAATPTDLDAFFLASDGVSGTTIGSANVIIDPTFFDSLQLGPLTWDTANAALLVGKGLSMFDQDISTRVPLATIFPPATTVVSVDDATNTIVMSNVALKTSVNYGVDLGVVVSATTPTAGFYQLIASSGAGDIDFTDPPIGLTDQYGLTGYGGQLLAEPPAGSTLTYTPSLVWSTYPEMRTYADPGAVRAIDINNVPETVLSYSRFNNPIVIGADASGNGAGWPTISGRADSQRYYQGISLVRTGLDTRPTGEIVTGSPLGLVPAMAVNIVNYETPDATGNAVLQRQAREKQGPLVTNLTGAGNINTFDYLIYARQNQGLGSIRFNGFSGITGVGAINAVAPNAGIYTRAEADFIAATNTPTGLYIQYTPNNLGSGNPRTFIRAENQATTIGGGNVVYIKPVSNYAAGNATVARNAKRELNAVQDTIWLQASYYGGGGNANSESSGSQVQIRGDRTTGNVALGINRAVGTTGSYELIIKTGESALTLYDKTNAANIATFTNTVSSFFTPVKFPVFTIAAAGAVTGAVGMQISISDSLLVGGRMAFWDTTNARWSYVSDNTAI